MTTAKRNPNIKIRHFLADGTEVESVQGHVIENPEFYAVVNRMIARLAAERAAAADQTDESA